MREVLDRLGEADREVLLLAEWECLTPAQIAEVVGCLPVTARGRLHRARHRFRTAFERRARERGYPGEPAEPARDAVHRVTTPDTPTRRQS